MRKPFPLIVVVCSIFLIRSVVSAETLTCLSCHSAIKAKVKTDKGIFVDLHIDEELFTKSVHGGIECTVCHKSFKENPHEPPTGEVPRKTIEIANLISGKASIDPIALSACNDCHSDVYNSLLKSIHGKNIVDKKQKDGAFCIDCHGSPHYIVPSTSKDSPVNKWKVVKTCGNCHDKDEIAKKYNLGTHIIEKYNESFHGKKHVLGHPGAPTCVDCHGYHDIKKWDDPESPVSWEKRVETCGKCHKGANKKFITAITHKPIGKDNPIPYYAEKGLIILTLSVFAFVVGHVLLEVYSEIRDRVFRKGKEE